MCCAPCSNLTVCCVPCSNLTEGGAGPQEGGQGGGVRVDPLQRLHTLHNLHLLLEEGVEGAGRHRATCTVCCHNASRMGLGPSLSDSP